MEMRKTRVIERESVNKFAKLFSVVLVLSFLVLTPFASAADFVLRNKTSQENYFVVNGTTGNVGVGNINPSNLFEVNAKDGQSVIFGDSSDSGSNKLRFLIDFGSGTNYIQSGMSSGDAASDLIFSRYNTGTSPIDRIYFYTDDAHFSGALTAGKTSSTSYMFEVNGTSLLDGNVLVNGDGNFTGNVYGNDICLDDGTCLTGVAANASSSIWSLNGVNTYYNDGNVGIGTDNPGDKLHVLNNNQSIGSKVGIRFSPTTASSRYSSIEGLQEDGNNRIGLVFNTGAGSEITEKMRIDSYGRVGIGTNPTAKLHVNTGNAEVKFSDDLGNGFRGVEVSGTNPTLSFNPSGADQYYFSSLPQGLSLFDATGDTGYRLVVDPSGNVGIGEAIPNAKLDVAGSLRADGTLYLEGGTSDPGSRTVMLFRDWNSGVANFMSVNDNNLHFATYDGGVPTDTNKGFYLQMKTDGTSDLKVDGNSVLTSADNGNVNASDSDTLDGYDSSYFMPLNKSVYGDFDFNGGWTNNGVSIVGGNLYAQSGYFYDINSLQVSTLTVNGSIIPPSGFDNQFDIGSSSLRWKNGYFGNKVGIGVVAEPQSKLEVRSNTDARITINRQGGWATSPADIKFNTNDDGTDAWTFGMKADSTNTMRLARNGVDFLTVDDGGQVAIGTTDASGTLKLDVEGQVGATEYCDETGANCVDIASIGDVSSNASGTINQIAKFTGANTIGDSIITDDGTNVGIGTTSPQEDLHVANDLDPTLAIGTLTANQQNSGKISFRENLGTEEMYLKYDGNLNQLKLGGRVNGDAIKIGRDTNDVSIVGNTGIGISSPTVKLDVNGSINLPDDQAIKFGGDDFVRVNDANSAVMIGKGTGSAPTDSVYVGYEAGLGNTASNIRQTLIGHEAGKNVAGSQFVSTTAVGFNAAGGARGNMVTAVGESAGATNTGGSVNFFGAQAGLGNSGSTVIGIGQSSARFNTGTYVDAIGYEAGFQNSGDHGVFIGFRAGKGNTQDNQFIVRQENVHTDPLIQGDFATGDVAIRGNLFVGGTQVLTLGNGDVDIW